MAGDVGTAIPSGPLHNADAPTDVNEDGRVSSLDALAVVNHITRVRRHAAEEQISPSAATAVPTTEKMVDVDNNGVVTAKDALIVINDLAIEGEILVGEGLPGPLDYTSFPKDASVDSLGFNPDLGAATTPYNATFNKAFRRGGAANLLTTADVNTLLERASASTRSDDAIIAVVDRNGTILGVRVEAGVNATLQGDDKALAFAIDGAVAKARTAAFFSSNAAPLTSRTIRSLSQSTVTQREVEASPVAEDSRYEGPGFVAPIGVGGKFPPEVDFTPQVDLFAIEHQSRDSQRHAGADQIKGNLDDFYLRTRFNADPTYIPKNAEGFFQSWPEAYGVQTESFFDSQSRGVATLPGGIPLYKAVMENGSPVTSPLSESINLVGGIGVFFPGEDGYATHEQGFQHGVGQSEKARTNADRVLEAEFAAFMAAAGGGMVTPNGNFQRNLSEFNSRLPALPNFVLPNGRIDLVGITLEIYGPNPTRQFRIPGIDRLIQVGRMNFGGPGFISGSLQKVNKAGDALLPGQPVPEGWLVAPHDSVINPGLTAEVVDQVITQGIAEAEITRAAIRLNIDNQFKPGSRTRMVLSVTDTNGDLLGLYRMPDATVFSIDVAVAKARNTAYYADPTALQDQDRVDFNGDGIFGPISKSLADTTGDTVPVGTALTNRTFRFLVEPRYPTGQELAPGSDIGLVNDAALDFCDQRPALCLQVAPQSILRMPGINPVTGENLENADPLPASVYKSIANEFSVLAFDAFNPSRNFRDPGDAEVIIQGDGAAEPLANQNGIVFFPGSTPLYLDDNPALLVGGFGVSGDGVDQDDVVTWGGQKGYAPPSSIRVDQFPVAGVRLPFQKFNRNPFGA